MSCQRETFGELVREVVRVQIEGFRLWMISEGGAVAEVVKDAWQRLTKSVMITLANAYPRAGTGVRHLTHVLMSARQLIPGERDSVSLAHVLLHVHGDCAGQQFSPEHPFVIWLGAFVNDNASDERLKGEDTRESRLSIS
jgi:hypothetical protein